MEWWNEINESKSDEKKYLSIYIYWLIMLRESFTLNTQRQALKGIFSTFEA